MYFAYYGHSNMSKNKLETAIQNYLHKLDRVIIQDGDFSTFKNSVITEIKRLSKEDYPRCKPKNPSFHKCRGNDVVLSGVECVNFYIYHSTKSFREGVIFLDQLL